MTREEKAKIVQEYVGIFEKPGVYLMDFTGLDVAQITGLRRKLRESDILMRVVKNTLALRALNEIGNSDLDSFLVGPVGVVYSDESTTPAKVLFDFIKEADKGAITAGLVDGLIVNIDEIKAISKLPTKLELQARVAAALNAPMVKLARTLNALPTKLARTVMALSEKVEAE